jgi:hypothetical protein
MATWFKWRRATPAPDVPLSPPPVEEAAPEPPRSSFVEKILRWRAVFAAQRAVQPTTDEAEAAREQALRQRVEAVENEIAKSIAFKGYLWPGEASDDVPGSRGGPFAWMSGEAEAQRRADFDWRACVDERQRQDIDAGGRG